MSYAPHNFQRGDELLASQLNEMDDQIAENDAAARTLIEVSNEEPLEETNRIWIKESTTEIQIPTMGDIQNLIGSPLTANTISDMTNTDRIYVYTGSETGYINGNWYYYNDDEWVSGGVYNAVAVNTDDTLSVEGAPADAAAVGLLKNRIDILNPDATASDVGKALIAKTISNGKVTEYEFGEAGGGGSSGTYDYEDLDNKPQINNIPLSGNKSAGDLDLASEDVIIFAASEPTSLTNKLWINSSDTQSVSVPTVADMNAAVGTKITAPSQAGTSGQVLSLDNNLNTVWVNQPGGSGGGIPAPSSPSDGQFLVYSSAQSAWVAQTVPSANGVSF